MKTIDEFENMIDDAKCAIDDFLENDYDADLLNKAVYLLTDIKTALYEAETEKSEE